MIHYYTDKTSPRYYAVSMAADQRIIINIGDDHGAARILLSEEQAVDFIKLIEDTIDASRQEDEPTVKTDKTELPVWDEAAYQAYTYKMHQEHEQRVWEATCAVLAGISFDALDEWMHPEEVVANVAERHVAEYERRAAERAKEKDND